MSLSLNAEHRDDGAVLVTAAGSVTHQNAQQVPGAVHAAIVRWAPTAVFFDVAAVTQVDAADVAALTSAGERSLTATSTGRRP